jgi:hypothetical protein
MLKMYRFGCALKAIANGMQLAFPPVRTFQFHRKRAVMLLRGDSLIVSSTTGHSCVEF